MQARDYDLSGPEFTGAMDREQIAVEDTCVAHAQTPHFEEVIGARIEKRRVELVTAFDVFGGGYGRACSDTADDGNPRSCFSVYRVRRLESFR